MNGLMYSESQPTNRITGISSALSQPSGTFRRIDSGRRLNTKPATRMPIGSSISRLKMPGR
ncbi:hypothetical protein D3C73_1590550 [compost metagenome]